VSGKRLSSRIGHTPGVTSIHANLVQGNSVHLGNCALTHSVGVYGGNAAQGQGVVCALAGVTVIPGDPQA
jgi:hypothetical protein